MVALPISGASPCGIQGPKCDEYRRNKIPRAGKKSSSMMNPQVKDVLQKCLNSMLMAAAKLLRITTPVVLFWISSNKTFIVKHDGGRN